MICQFLEYFEACPLKLLYSNILEGLTLLYAFTFEIMANYWVKLVAAQFRQSVLRIYLNGKMTELKMAYQVNFCR